GQPAEGALHVYPGVVGLTQALEELAFLCGEPCRQHHLDPRQQIAGSATLEVRHPLAPQPEDAAVLCLGWDRQDNRMVERVDDDLAPENRGVERDLDFGAQVLPFDLEPGVGHDRDPEIDVAIWPAVDAGRALTRDANPGAVSNTGGDLDLE